MFFSYLKITKNIGSFNNEKKNLYVNNDYFLNNEKFQTIQLER